MQKASTGGALAAILFAASLIGQSGFGSAQVISTASEYPNHVVAADVDGDGDLDVLSASALDDKIAWYENLDGRGSFGAQQVIATNMPFAQKVYATDVDGDGDLDVIAAASQNDQITWYENTDGQGSFGAEQVVATPLFSVADIYVTDIDGDGDGDIVAVDGAADQVAWFENTNGQGSFSGPQIISTAVNAPLGVFAADADGDGDIDVFTRSIAPAKIAWFENLDGQGSFGAQQVITTNVVFPWDVYAADIDGDGDVDALSASGPDNKVAWYENTNGQGSFGAQQVITTNSSFPGRVYAADVDGDGDMDVLSASWTDNKIVWNENLNGQGIFGPPRIISTSSQETSSVAAADLDGDGDLDVLASSRNDDTIAWYENQFAAAPETLGVGCGGDAGNFSTESTITVNADAARRVYSADVDGDGDMDVLSASASDNKIAWYENTDGQGTFGAQQVISTNAAAAWSVYAADVDGDGDNDVLSASLLDDKIAWYENTDGLGNFSTEQIISTNANGATDVYTADFDGDGDADVLAAYSGDDKVVWFENTDGLGNFSAEQVVTTAADANLGMSVHASDVDGDGDIDVLSASDTDNKIAWYENTDGLGNFGAQQVISTNAIGAYSVYTADVDGDGDMDALSASRNDDKVALYENLDGLGNFGPQQVVAIGGRPWQVYAADVDADGDMDVLAAFFNDNTITWSENLDGLGIFGPQRVITAGAMGAKGVHATDLDGDGDLDVVSASTFDDRIAWYRNDRDSLILSSNSLEIGETWTLQADNVVGATAIFYLGNTVIEPPFDLGPLGAPGCFIYTNAAYGCFPRPASGGSSSMSWPVPNDPALVGCVISAQSTCAAPNALTFSTSNGLRATAGY